MYIFKIVCNNKMLKTLLLTPPLGGWGQPTTDN